MNRPSRAAGLLLRAPGINRLARLLGRWALRPNGPVGAEMRLGPELVFAADLLRNIDRDNDGRADAFCVAVQGGWFSQDLLDVEVWLNGRRVPPERLLLRYPDADEPIETPLSAARRPLRFLPGRPLEIICAGCPLGQGLHLISLRLVGTLIDVPVPLLPVLVQGERVTIPLLDPPVESGAEELSQSGPAVACHWVPHVHYDLVWLKDRATLAELGRRNLAEALRLLERDPAMTFVIDQGPQVESLRERPELFQALVAQVQAGRIEPVNGLWAEPDTYVPGLESLCRGSIRWQRYSQRVFGRLSRVGWLIDSFGMSPQLPQILVKSGTTALVFTRCAPRAAVPSEFSWIGLDGTALLAAYLSRMYFAGYPLAQSSARAFAQLRRIVRALRPRAASRHLLVPAGLDHGRPQSAGALFDEWNASHPRARFEYSSPSRFFSALGETPLAEVRGELGPDLAGCYGGRVRTKQLNRAAETSLAAAEFSDAWAWRLGRQPRAEQLDPAWEATLSCQFHDSIAGPIPDNVAAQVDSELERAIALADRVRDAALSDLATWVRPAEVGQSFVVANPLPWPRRGLVRLTLAPGEDTRRMAVFDPRGRRVPCQILEAHRFADGGLYDVSLCFIAELPAAGYAVYSAAAADDPAPAPEAALRAHETELAGPLLRAAFDPHDGTLLALEQPGRSRVELRRGAALALQRDLGSLYYGVPLGPLTAERGPYCVRLLECGPLLARLSVEGRIGRGRFRRIYSLAACDPYLSLEIEVDFADPGRRLILRLPTNLSAARWRNEAPGGFVSGGRGERPAVRISDLASPNAGLALINDGVPGHRRQGGELRLTLHRAVDQIHFYQAGGGALGVGLHRARLALLPHGPDFAASAPWQAAQRFLQPLLIMPLDPRAAGQGPAQGSLLRLEPTALACDALYVEDDELVLRFHESAGAQQRARVSPGFKIAAARLTDLLGRATQQLVLADPLEFPVGPWEIVTLRLTAK